MNVVTHRVRIINTIDIIVFIAGLFECRLAQCGQQRTDLSEAVSRRWLCCCCLVSRQTVHVLDVCVVIGRMTPLSRHVVANLTSSRHQDDEQIDDEYYADEHSEDQVVRRHLMQPDVSIADRYITRSCTYTRI